jgi:polygalacturonase
MISKYISRAFIFCCFAFTSQYSLAQESTGIIENNSTHILRITKDSIVLVSGTTYSFNVDTPEDKGLVSTGVNLQQLIKQLAAKDGSVQTYSITDKDGIEKNKGTVINGDHLVVSSNDTKEKKTFYVSTEAGAVGGELRFERDHITVNTARDLTLYFTAGQRTPNATLRIYFPEGINITGDNTTVNVIGRGDVKLNDLATQSMGRLGSAYPYKKVGNFAISKSPEGGSVLLFKHLDLRPSNGADLKIIIKDVRIGKPGKYIFKAIYSTTKPEMLTSPGTGAETATLTATSTLSDLERVVDKSIQYKQTLAGYNTVTVKWPAVLSTVELMQSIDAGKSYFPVPAKIDNKNSSAVIQGLQPDKYYCFKLNVKEGEHKGLSNPVYYYSGMLDIKKYETKADGKEDNTEQVNSAIDWLNSIGGGTLLFSDGIYNIRTVHLKSNVYLYVSKGATIKAIKGADAPETTWFSDKKYRSGLSPTDTGPYDDPENWLTKQDVGHHYFRNCMFFGERLDNIKIIGNGRITGDGNLVTGDNVMRNTPDNRGDKMIVCKLCTNIEIGGIYRKDDLWYDSTKDEPYYIKNGTKDFDIDNMLHIDRPGHFALLATGTDNINVHDTYFGKNSANNTRDIYDFMECNNVNATNIYCKVSSDDIIKPGSDCSLGFTRPAKNYKVRNIIGDTNCNLFQIGSETADDIQDIHVDNIYVLGANKAGFSISTNDGAHIKDIHLNCGHTGSLHSRSKMLRTYTPFFISISNRGRILGAAVSRHKFDENGVKHDELLVNNVDIGTVENIILNGIDVSEVYGGSSYGGKERWKAFDGSQKKATAIIAGYALPDASVVEGGKLFSLPNGNTGYIKNISFTDVRFLYKGRNNITDTSASPPELGVGQYNASNLKLQPSWGLWARHVKGITVNNCSFNYEQPDKRYPIYLDDVKGATFSDIKMVKAKEITAIGMKNSSGVVLKNNVYYNDTWGKSANTSGENKTNTISLKLINASKKNEKPVK